MKKQALSELKIEEVFENLANIAALDLEAGKGLGLVKEKIVVLDDDEFLSQDIDWVGLDNAEEVLKRVESYFDQLYHYLRDIYEDKETDWNDPDVKKGIQSIMTLVIESAKKLDLYLVRFQKLKLAKIVDSSAFHSLKVFYLEHLSKKFETAIEGDAAWSNSWNENEAGLILDLEKTGLCDFETIKSDLHYELFYLKDENGKPFFNSALLKNIKLVCEYDEKAKGSFDPLLQIRSFKEKDAKARAEQILKGVEKALLKYFEKGFFRRDEDIVVLINKAIYALMLAKNSKELSLAKTSLQYFHDFQHFLREALSRHEYEKWRLSTSDDAYTVIQLVNEICKLFFTSRFGAKEELIGFIYRLARDGEMIEKKRAVAGNLYEKLLWDDQCLKSFLANIPSGPLFKLLDTIEEMEENEREEGFDPILQGNWPSLLYVFKPFKKKVLVLSLPSPTSQTIITKAGIVGEFLAFINSLETKESALFIDLQDRTSLLEYSRSHALTEIQKKAVFEDKLHVCSLSLDGDFYCQTGEYEKLNVAGDFKAVFREQLRSEGAGFYFTKKIMDAGFVNFLDKALDFVHREFYEEKKNLNKEERLDFIEIFYFFLCLKLLEICKADYFGFVSKDSLDTAMAKQALFFIMMKLLVGEALLKEDEEFLLYLFEAFPLLVRERGIHSERIVRTLQAVAYFRQVIDKKSSAVFKSMSDLFGVQLSFGSFSL